MKKLLITSSVALFACTAVFAQSPVKSDSRSMTIEEANRLNGTANPTIIVDGKAIPYSQYVAQQKAQQVATNAQTSGLKATASSPSSGINPANAPAGVAPTNNNAAPTGTGSFDRTTIKTEVAAVKTETVAPVNKAAYPAGSPVASTAKTVEPATTANSSSNSAPTEAKASVAKASSETSSTNSGLKHAPAAKETNFVSPAVTPLKAADVPVAAAKSAPVEAASTAPQFPGSANVQTTSGANAELLQVSASAQAAGSNNLPAAKAGTTQVAMEAVPESKVNSEVKKPAATLQGGQKSKD